ncbi:MAG TPA: ABC transporter ATP-binding protein, partial [Candidatus Saccharimonadales bacterium]|nr:ABC transporter ATP-binding protein [Candidatus Saccharimonadales bacterium]
MSTNTKTIKIFISHARRYPWLTAGSLLLGLAFALQAIVAPLFIAKILGQLAGHSPVSAAYIWLTALSLFGGALLWYVVDWGCSAPLTLNIIRDMHTANFDKLLSQEYGFFVNNFAGSLVTQANRFAKAFELFHNTFFLEVIGQFWAVLIALGIMLYYNLVIGLLVMVCWIIAIVIVVYLGIKRMPVRRHAVAAETEQTGELADAVTNAITVKTFASENFEAKRYHKINQERYGRFRDSWKIGIRNNSAIQAMCGVLQLVVLVGGIRAVQNGSISIAIFLLFEVYILRIIDSIGKSSLFVRQFEGLLGDAHEMTELLGRLPLIKDPPLPETLRIKAGQVSFRGVHFSYNPRQDAEQLFQDLNLDIAPGEHVGLVGPSGGGKTTITRLLLRFHDINGGTIAIDGQGITAIRQTDLHQCLAYVPQEPLLFHRSLAENIGYGQPSASLAEIQAVAKRAHADEFIRTLPQGYDTLVGERGIKLSGGQRQRVAIARAMLKNAPILLLDEATSALDSESEKLIQDALWKLMEGRTALVIAHRLSTVQRLNRIVVLDKGK